MSQQNNRAFIHDPDQECQIVAHLSKHELFEDLTYEELNQITAFSHMHSLDDGALLIHENDIERFDIYVLCNGSLEVVSNTTEVTSEEVVISKSEKDIFGEIGWLCQNKRSADVRCYGPVEVIEIDGDALRTFVQENPKVGYNIMRRTAIMVSRNLTETNSLLKQVLWANHI